MGLIFAIETELKDSSFIMQTMMEPLVCTTCTQYTKGVYCKFLTAKYIPQNYLHDLIHKRKRKHCNGN